MGATREVLIEERTRVEFISRLVTGGVEGFTAAVLIGSLFGVALAPPALAAAVGVWAITSAYDRPKRRW